MRVAFVAADPAVKNGLKQVRVLSSRSIEIANMSPILSGFPGLRFETFRDIWSGLNHVLVHTLPLLRPDALANDGGARTPGRTAIRQFPCVRPVGAPCSR
jgi:hypothetical protein